MVSVVVRLSNLKTLSFDLGSNETVLDLKKKIFSSCQIAISEQILVVFDAKPPREMRDSSFVKDYLSVVGEKCKNPLRIGK